MKTGLQYLPELKRQELEHICKIIVSEMQPALVILFGSYARNTWAEEITREEGINLEFKSDYDVLVVTPEDLDDETNRQWIKVQQKIRNSIFSTYVSIIQHSAPYINYELKAGGYFFSDVITEGVVLYHDGYTSLAAPGDVDPVEVKKRAGEEYRLWFKKAIMFQDTFEYNLQMGHKDADFYKLAAFQLHQATESFYTAVLLYLTGYKGKLHDIEELSRKVCKLMPEFKSVFPTVTKEQKHHFNLLKRAYIDARYKRSYSITQEELEYLSARVKKLKGLTAQICSA